MITCERSTDYKLIREILIHPRIYSHAADDYSVPPEEFVPPESEHIYYVIVRDDEEVLGMFVFVPHSRVMWEIHTCLLPASWGARAAGAARAVIDWLWSNTDCRRMITNVPAYNRLALRFARTAGLTEFGRNPASILKDGILHEQIMLGISKDKH